MHLPTRCGALSLLVLLATHEVVVASAGKPNFVVLFVDDLGYGDIGVFGRENISTPHVDSLAHDGLKLTQWLSAAPICTPSRAGLQTGRLAHRFGMTANVEPWRVFMMPCQPGGFPPEELTIAEVLRDEGGYATGMSGKWHLGINNYTHPGAHLPLAHGYDSWLGLPYTNMQGCREGNESAFFCMMMANHTVIQQPFRAQNMTSHLTTHSLDFIRTAVAREKPFFLLHSFMHVHTALFSSPAFTNVSQGGRFGDNVEEMDHSVGQILTLLEELGIENDTAVFFTSDNGNYAEEGWDQAGRSGGLTGSKGQTWEGGIRVPGIVRWPGKVPAGVVSDEAVGTLDIMPTMLAMAGIQLPAGAKPLDGKDVSSFLFAPDSATSPHDTMFHYCGHNVTAMRIRWPVGVAAAGRNDTSKLYKLHFQSANWTTAFEPSPKCVQCCPDCKTSLGGHGGCTCDCNPDTMIRHDPPLLFNIDDDKFEQDPLTASSFSAFDALVTEAHRRLAAHYASLDPNARDEMVTIPDPLLEPCCHGVWPENCECDDYSPHKVYP